MDNFSLPTKQQKISHQQKLHEALKKEWLAQTFSLCSDLDITADVVFARMDSFLFKLGKKNPLAVLQTSFGAEIRYLADVDGKLQEQSMKTRKPNWDVLISEVILALHKHRNEIVF